MKIEIYSSAFNLNKNGFIAPDHIQNFCRFADRVTIAVNTSNDGTLKTLNDIKGINDYRNLNIVSCDFSYEDPLLDGKIKNFALSRTKLEIKLGIDLDELINLDQRPLWDTQADRLLNNKDISGLLIPSVDLYDGLETVRWDSRKNIAAKWYLHKHGCFRGPIQQAVQANGTIDISKSDGCELIDSQGNLVKFQSLVPFEAKTHDEYYNKLFQLGIWVWHTGHVDKGERVIRNREFWAEHWNKASGQKIKVPVSIGEFEEYDLFEHRLPWNI